MKMFLLLKILLMETSCVENHFVYSRTNFCFTFYTWKSYLILVNVLFVFGSRLNCFSTECLKTCSFNLLCLTDTIRQKDQNLWCKFVCTRSAFSLFFCVHRNLTHKSFLVGQREHDAGTKYPHLVTSLCNLGRGECT